MTVLKLTGLSSIALFLSAIPLAQAATIDSDVAREVFQSSFAAGALLGENFDSLESGITINTVNSVTYSVSDGSPVITIDYSTTTPPNALGTSFGFFDSTQSPMISFAMPITAFAIDINTFASNPRAYVGTLDIGLTVNSQAVIAAPASNVQFIGFTSDTPFNSVSITPVTGQGPFSYTLDNLIYGDAAAATPGNPIPEPSTWGLFLIGLGLLAYRERGRHLTRLASRFHHLVTQSQPPQKTRKYDFSTRSTIMKQKEGREVSCQTFRPLAPSSRR